MDFGSVFGGGGSRGVDVAVFKVVAAAPGSCSSALLSDGDDAGVSSGPPLQTTPLLSSPALTIASTKSSAVNGSPGPDSR